ncbi:MAG TPA: ABC transporter ATP-binding protein [Pirellulales bacterium]|jgi:putative ABC transport system ATP-binding protein|nr:ABC transporter ATP-binding protein [Pirellulales bacterium]
MAAPIVKVTDLHKAYRRGAAPTPVLCGLDLEIGRGECVFLVGPSGSGKSTLLSILGCILTPDRGRVEILGENLGQLSERRRAAFRRDRIGFVFQRFHLIRGLNALENVCVPLTLRGVAAKAAESLGRRRLTQVGLAAKADCHPANLSTGQCQRVALARALAGEPELVLADEPTASLDAENGREVVRLLRDMTSRENKAALVVTHDQRIFEFADRILVLDGGRVRRAPADAAGPEKGAAPC